MIKSICDKTFIKFKFQQISQFKGESCRCKTPVALSRLRQNRLSVLSVYLTLAANFLFLNTVSVPKGPPSTSIAVSSGRAGLSDGVRVVCTVLGEPDVDVSFRWQYPGQEVRGVCPA